jgi:hypothetical protein
VEPRDLRTDHLFFWQNEHQMKWIALIFLHVFLYVVGYSHIFTSLFAMQLNDGLCESLNNGTRDRILCQNNWVVPEKLIMFGATELFRINKSFWNNSHHSEPSNGPERRI